MSGCTGLLAAAPGKGKLKVDELAGSYAGLLKIAASQGIIKPQTMAQSLGSRNVLDWDGGCRSEIGRG